MGLCHFPCFQTLPPSWAPQARSEACVTVFKRRSHLGPPAEGRPGPSESKSTQGRLAPLGVCHHHHQMSFHELFNITSWHIRTVKRWHLLTPTIQCMLDMIAHLFSSEVCASGRKWQEKLLRIIHLPLLYKLYANLLSSFRLYMNSTCSIFITFTFTHLPHFHILHLYKLYANLLSGFRPNFLL